ncbi:MAG: DNA-3-methyladenine glycosylase I [Ruminococcus sp.]|nr:DNA-3-methyladenine glycosylase I [Ruminococcus sp.]MCM1382545.1 DNA-3-methyladenine glycosylase I [Muribaculaceae bacterium]MCM1479470.1 DNA-3-methyladenine glycosylase I [Muribaculaceae bacterium]
MKNTEISNRCSWVNMKNPLYIDYHDNEWGAPCHDERMLYELLILECFQAGLSWECILNKRQAFREAFDNFDVDKVARYGEKKREELLSNTAIVRNKLKINASIANSVAFKEIQREYGSFDKYIWGFTGGETVSEEYSVRTTSPLSDTVSKDLKKRGMKFVGSTIIYSYLQAIGVINGHGKECEFYAGIRNRKQGNKSKQ